MSVDLSKFGGGVLEELIVNNRENYPDDLRAARNLPRNGKATARLNAALLADPDADDSAVTQLEKLRELADLGDEERIVDVAIRGEYITFQVADGEGAVSPGAFKLEALTADSKRGRKRAAKKGGKADDRVETRGGSVEHGQATPDEPAEPGPDAPGADDDAGGLPDGIENMNRDAVIAQLKSPDDGVDPRAVARWEQEQREGGPRASVIKEAEKLGLFEPAPS